MPLSYENYTGDNVTTTFNIPFTYTATSEISVTVDGVAQTGLTFPSASQVQLTSAPASSTVVQVRRTTDLTSRAVDFASGSVLTEEDLDNANIQIFHSSQEAVDLTDDTIQEDVDSKWDAESKVIKNVANPTNAQDAATKDYIENTWLTPADKAQLNSLNIPNLNTVATNIADVNAVAADATDIGTVSTNIASVNTVATNIADVVTVANDLNEAISEIETAADDLNEAVSDIDTVSTNIANVNTVGGAIANVNTVAGAVANVNTTATNIADVNTVAGISGNVTTVANISANVTAVAGDATDIGTVATNIADINTVAGNNADIDTVAGISANVTSVAGNAANINTVAGISANVTTVATNNANVTAVAGNETNINSVAGNASNINSVAANETNINSVNSNSTNINTVATNISNVNSVGGSIANVNTVASNLASVNSFADTYRIGATDPTDSTDTGDLFYNTTSSALKVYTGSAWEQGVTAGSGFLPTTGGSITGNLSVSGDLTVDTNTLYVDSANNNVGIGTSSPLTALHVKGTTNSNVMIVDATGTSPNYIFDVRDNGTPKFRVDESGRLLIGTTTEGNTGADDLTIATTSNTGITIRSGTIHNGGIYFSDGTSGADEYRGYVDYDHNGNNLNFATDAVERMRIDSSGNVGIGTTQPFTSRDQGLTISGTSPTLYLEDTDSGSYTNCQLSFLGGEFSIYTGIRSGTGTSGSVQRLTIDSSGNVGIGTASPANALHVKGVTTVAYIESTGINGDIQLDASGTTGYTAIRANNNDLAFLTNTSERMRIDSSGNVGIGMTNSNVKLAVNDPTTNAHTTNIKIVNNSGWSGSIGYLKSLAWGDPNNLCAIGATFDGSKVNMHFHSFYNAGYKTETTKLMTILGNGRVGIGTDSPASKLEISSGVNSGGLLRLDDTDAGNLGGYMQFDSNGTNKANVQNANNAGIHLCVGTGGSVTFGALGYTAANALDDYEEGTFTATITAESGTIGSYSVASATYTKIGDTVHAHCRFSVSNTGNGTNFVVSGLPFTSARELLGTFAETNTTGLTGFMFNAGTGGTSFTSRRADGWGNNCLVNGSYTVNVTYRV